jgi:hypothetical protein
MKILILITLSTLLFACSNSQTEDTQSQLTAAQVKSGYECKSIKLSGSHIRKKICDTTAEREYKKEHAEEFTRKMRDERISASNQTW